MGKWGSLSLGGKRRLQRGFRIELWVLAKGFEGSSRCNRAIAGNQSASRIDGRAPVGLSQVGLGPDTAESRPDIYRPSIFVSISAPLPSHYNASRRVENGAPPCSL
jgi:hypothetical protein